MSTTRARDGPPRVLAVWWPDWPVVAAGVAPEEPVVVVRANRVLAASALARHEGVRVGHRRREAQAACPGVVVVVDDPARDARAFEPVLQALATLTPQLELTVPGECVFATRGPSRYFGGDAPLAERVHGLVVDAAGPDAPAISGLPGVGVADGRFAATLAARSAAASPVVVTPGESAAFLASFPIAAVNDDDLAGLLARLGITTLGSLATLPRGDVVARFGPSGGIAHRRASEGDDRPVDARSPPPDLAVQIELDPPVTDVGPVVFAGKHLADDLAARVQGLGLACTRLVVGVETEHGERLERCWRHDHAFNAAGIVERVRWQLEGWASGTTAARPTGGITLLRLCPDEVVPDAGRQLGFWGGRTQADERAARTVARLVGLLGPDGVAVPEWQGGRDPGAVAAVAAGAVELAERARRVMAPDGSGPWPGRLPVPAPAVVLAERRAADVLDGDGRPVVVGGRGQLSAAPVWFRVAGGAPRAVVAWAGPWPLDERWWDPAAHRRRARFQVLDETGVARLAVVEAGRWWVEADYD